MAWHAQNGDRVHALFLTDGVGARGDEATSDKALARRRCAEAALAHLGVSGSTFLTMPDNQLDRLPLLEIIQQIEPVIAATEPEIVYTHHQGDLNIDHRMAHQAALTALRPQPNRLRPTILCFEVPSSTEWQSPAPHLAFVPNWFHDISATFEHKKMALRSYQAEMRDWPHARSEEAVGHLAGWRGASVGVEAAEAFVLVRHVQR